MSDTEELPNPDAPPLLSALRWGGNALITIGLAFAAVVVLGWARAPALPEQAPDFVLPDLDGTPIALRDLRGQTVVLNFWATWCGPCRLEAPTFAKFAKDHPEIPILGIAVDGPAPKVRRVAQQLGMTYPVLLAEPSVLEDYGVRIFPTTVVVAPDGSIQWAHAGLMIRPQLAWATGRVW